MTESVKAYAKINLHLDVTEKRPDGYHNVQTVMQSVSLCDTVTVSPKKDGGFSCECDVLGVPTDEKNIALKAAMLFMSQIDSKCGAHVKIEKKIPMAAGLAGGSTDAAATLVALNRLYGKPLDENELCELGAKLGADVPFCISGGCVYSDGKGDILHPFASIPNDTVFVVACGGEGVSTPWAYGLLDRVFNDFSSYSAKGTDRLKNALSSSTPELFYKELFNIFEEPVLRERPVADEIKREMLKSGAKNAMMSGSGPSVFGIFENTESAERAAETIRKMGYFAKTCTPTEKREI